MSYQTDDGQHEGWDVAEFPDGRHSVGSGSGGTIVRPLGPAAGAGREVLDGRTAIGWRGPLWRRVPSPAEHDPAAHQAYDPDPSVYGDAPRGVEDAIHLEWLAHLPPPWLADVRTVARGLRDARSRLAQAAGRARSEGASWDDIGRAAALDTAELARLRAAAGERGEGAARGQEVKRRG